MENRRASDLRKQFINGDLSAKAIVEESFRRIEKNDNKTKSFLSLLNERALKKAEELDQKRAAGKAVGLLAGVPIAIKDNIHIRGEITSCASKFLTNYKAPFSATVVELLEKEDAILIGKTNLDEFAMGSSCEKSAIQKTYNPWNLDYVPGGSSGGSAAAVAARYCPIALGSDTGGSIRQPAALCGIFGFKPTYGRVSRSGLVAFGSSFDQIGPFATSAEDIALVMEVIGKHCDKDSTSLDSPPYNFSTAFKNDLKGIKVGVPFHLIEGINSETEQNFKQSLEIIKQLGGEVVEVNLDILRYAIAVYYILAMAEASTNLARFDGVRYGLRSKKAKSLDDLYDLSKEEGFGKEVKRRILLGTYVLSAGYQDAYYKKAQRVRTLMIEAFDEVFKSCDLISTPVSPSAAFKLNAIKDPLEMYKADLFTSSANIAGLPAISLPAGFNKEGLPLGLQLLAPQREDVRVVRAAQAFEKATNFSDAIPQLVKEGESAHEPAL